MARAVGSDEGNPEAWQTKARLSLVMEQFEVGMGRKLVFSDKLRVWMARRKLFVYNHEIGT